ncbi:tRNA (guanosine(46)-N(7))-methyltransferase TrmB [Paraferrimonas sp. SM1919]|uniref:tRNA (guanine(46)-N(7))-methyltransferase TrmB n=1 Tax=Paraferrimonas sp. SM1919 TaxID=2662263 RepID=UPI0013D3DE6B|nr:SAM-dependent methyltransferase [Paraferrimonas sp. SM1919]
MNDSRVITTNQNGLNEQLDEVVLKHLQTPFKKPISTHTQAAFDELDAVVKASTKPLILDSCCGVGESTRELSKRHPKALIIGLDKSAHRLGKHEASSEHGEYYLARVDLNDFWRLAVAAGWQPSHHYLLYPNPWPKAKHLQRRWHGASVFPSIIALGGKLELRSNWAIYLQEFQRALELAGHQSQFNELLTDNPITPFERKYQASGQQLWQLQCTL